MPMTSGYRGRLIFPFRVRLGLLDTAATAADPDGAGPLASGYDDEFREPVITTPTTGSGRGQVVRVERVKEFEAQVEDGVEGMLEIMATGNSPVNQIGLVMHFADLEREGVISYSNGKTSIKAPGARLIAILDPNTHELIERYDDSPGHWATQVKSMGYGIGQKRNLLLVMFQERAVSVFNAGS